MWCRSVCRCAEHVELVDHGCTASKSSAAATGPLGLPRASRLNALRKTSAGQPYCSASEAAMALSEAMMPAVEW